MVQSTHHRFSHDAAALGRLDLPGHRRIIVERLMGARRMVVLEEIAKDALEMADTSGSIVINATTVGPK